MKENKNNESCHKQNIILVNFVTGLRFIASFAVIPTFKILGGISAAIFSAIFLFTDCIDGFLARKLKASTFFGALFDGLTDKIFGIISFAILMSINPVIFSLPLILEICIALVQNKKLKNGTNIKSNMIGKIKTWILSLSIVSSFIAVDILNIPECFNYMKASSLANIDNIKNYLALIGIELPAIVFQILTLASYNKEANDDIKKFEKEQEEQREDSSETTEEIEYLTQEEKSMDAELTRDLNDIINQKESLLKIKETLAKLKLLTEKMLDPEYYAENKDMPIRKLTKDLFEK